MLRKNMKVELPQVALSFTTLSFFINLKFLEHSAVRLSKEKFIWNADYINFLIMSVTSKLHLYLSGGGGEVNETIEAEGRES